MDIVILRASEQVAASGAALFRELLPERSGAFMFAVVQEKRGASRRNSSPAPIPARNIAP